MDQRFIVLKYQDHHFARAYVGLSQGVCVTCSPAEQISISQSLVWLATLYQESRVTVGNLRIYFSDDVGECSHIAGLDLALVNNLREVAKGIKGIYIEFGVLDTDAKGRFNEYRKID